MNPGYRELESINLNSLSNLEYLHLTHTMLTPDLFENLFKLRKLTLYECSFSKLDENFLRNLPNLQVLEVFMCDQFNFNLDGPSNLKWLNLRKIIDFNSNIFKNISDELTVLNLSNNTIDNATAQLLFENLKTPKLANLHLGRNQLTSLNGRWFVGLVNLKELILESNQIERIDLRGCDFLANLEVLDLHGNSIEVLTEATFESLKSLRVLYLGDNPIRQFESGVFRGLDRLEKIYLVSLRNEGFDRIGENFFDGLANLCLLKLNFNRLTFIDSKGFFGLRNLRELDLSRNRIRMDTDTFSELVNLKSLDLSRNGFEDVGENIFQSLSCLERLSLAYNHLKCLKTGSFRGLLSLKYLDLSFNVLADFSGEVVSHLPRLEKVNLKYNPFQDYDRISNSLNGFGVFIII